MPRGEACPKGRGSRGGQTQPASLRYTRWQPDRENDLWLFLKGAFARSPHDRSPIINNSLQRGVLGGICGPNRCAYPRSSFSEAGAAAAAAAMRSSCQCCPFPGSESIIVTRDLESIKMSETSISRIRLWI